MLYFTIYNFLIREVMLNVQISDFRNMPGKSGKRKVNFNRELVRCSVCNKELQKDNFDAHKAKFHSDKPSAQFIVVNDKKQAKLCFTTKMKDDDNRNPSVCDPAPDNQDQDPSSELKDETVDLAKAEADQLWNIGISPGCSPPRSPNRVDLDIVLPSSKYEIVSRNPGYENNNEVSTTAIAGTSSGATSVSNSIIDLLCLPIRRWRLQHLRL